EFTLAAIIFAGKKAPFLAQDARKHRDDWSYAARRGELSNRGRTIGVVGFSRVGRRVTERLRGLEVDILVADPYADPAEVRAAGGRLVGLHDLLRRCDVLTLHVPALPATRHLIGPAELALLRDGATVINTARGSVLDTAALESECVSGRLDAILDVTEPEPLPADSPLYDLPNVMITPHIAGSLGSETRRMSESALDELERYLTGLPPRAPVTAEEIVVSARARPQGEESGSMNVSRPYTRRTLVKTLGAAASLALALTACGSGGGSDDSAAEGGGSQTLTVTVWNLAKTPEFGALFEAFEKANPGVKVEPVDILADDYPDKVTTMLAGGDKTDVITMKNVTDYSRYSSRGQLLDITDMVKSIDTSKLAGLDAFNV